LLLKYLGGRATSGTASDLIDWPRGSRDGYVAANNSVSAVANSYIAVSTALVFYFLFFYGKA
jgi:hypothetical protein